MYDTGIQLPWDQPRARRQRLRSSERVQLIRYGAAAAGGALVFNWLRRKVCRLPVVGLVAAPLLVFVPTTLIGAALGACALYGYDEGDLLAVKRKLVPKVRKHIRRVKREVTALADDIGSDLRQLTQEHDRALQRLTREGEAAARRLSPVVEDTARQLEAAWERSYQRGKVAANRQLAAHEDSD